MYLLIISLPLTGSIIALVFGKFLGRTGVSLITVFNIFLTFLVSCLLFYKIALEQRVCLIKAFTWIDLELVVVEWGGFFDTLTVVMLVLITFISLLVHVYSVSYMSDDPYLIRFMAYLSLFTFFMILLVVSNNFLQLFVGWEGVGLCSYLLINFWHTRIQANKAAIKAMLVNRVGDFFLSLGIFLTYFTFNSLNYAVIFATCDLYLGLEISVLGWSVNALNLITFFLFLGAIGKSAQIGLHTWLPDAMEGPTPVSALIHAATMVTAGIFLIVRCSPLFECCPGVLSIVASFGVLTAFFGSTTALFQNDIKKIIAYSTCSQLGYMFLICGLSHYSIGVFHLFNHGFFKALLFLGSGSIIHSLNDEQDLRKMGGLRQVLPFTYSVMVIGSFSLMGFPFLTGYYSKDAILEICAAVSSEFGFFVYGLGVLTAFITAAYSIRLIYLVFLSGSNGFKASYLHVHDAPVLLGIPLFLLALGSIFIGAICRDMFIGLGTPFWGNAIYVLPEHFVGLQGEFLGVSVKLFPTVCVFVGAGLSLIWCMFYRKFSYLLKLKFKALYRFFNKKWYFDRVFNSLVVQKVLMFCFHDVYKLIDKGLLESLGPRGLVKQLSLKSFYLQQAASGFLIHYLLFIVFGGFFLFFIIFFLQSCGWFFIVNSFLFFSLGFFSDYSITFQKKK